MALKSMTGFARSQGQSDDVSWGWEIRSVNGRGLDVRTRLPSGHEALESDLRKMLTERFKRGNIQTTLTVARGTSNTQIRINGEVLSQILAVLNEMAGKVEASPPSLDGILGLKGIIETVEPEEGEDQRNARLQAILKSFGDAVNGLEAARIEEGKKLASILADQLKVLSELVANARSTAAGQAEQLRNRLREQIDGLINNPDLINADRLEQEIAFLSAKADVTEEIDRLEAHTSAAKDLIESDEPAGRRFDFLLQEFNREANTLCSKSTTTALTQIGLELKSVIDQIREQVQNVE